MYSIANEKVNEIIRMVDEWETLSPNQTISLINDIIELPMTDLSKHMLNRIKDFEELLCEDTKIISSTELNERNKILVTLTKIDLKLYKLELTRPMEVYEALMMVKDVCNTVSIVVNEGLDKQALQYVPINLMRDCIQRNSKYVRHESVINLFPIVNRIEELCYITEVCSDITMSAKQRKKLTDKAFELYNICEVVANEVKERFLC